MPSLPPLLAHPTRLCAIGSGSLLALGLGWLVACGTTDSSTATATGSVATSSTSVTGSGGATASSGAGGGTTTSSSVGTGGSGGSGGSGNNEVTGDFASDFLAPELVGRPTTTSAVVNVLPAKEVQVAIEHGPSTGNYTQSTLAAVMPAGKPTVLSLDGLAADSAVFYRVKWRKPGTDTYAFGPERTFRTARAKGKTFRFTVQSDSHLDANTTVAQYHRTLTNVLADAPDFHLDLGDTFMTEKHSEPLTDVVKAAADEPTVVKRYVFERDHFGVVGHSVPLFLVNGNHDAELGYLFQGAGNDLATWATRARKAYYVNPMPNAFYSGDSMKDPVVGERAAWYAFTWGDALFVALDPFWNTKVKPGKDPWQMTLGKAQFDWLAATLSASTATYKFVFLHNLVGGLDGQQRGGVEAAPFFEWGGLNGDSTPGFATKRPGWSKPIHDLLVAAKVTAVFHGHDHVYVHQEKDGIVYQALPQPSAKNTKNGASLAAAYHYDSGTPMTGAGHVRVTVAPEGVTSEFIRAWLPADESATQKNGETAHSWKVTSP